MFKVLEGDFQKDQYGKEKYLDNWPMLYILENGKQAYIGESNHVMMRMKEHHRSQEKAVFKKVHFIYSKIFNQSVTFDYESKLIQYVAADCLFQITNKNAGIADKQYFQKKKYDEEFPLLWSRLQTEKLVKHSLEEIEKSDLFKYSPYKELNDDQRISVENILEQLAQGQNNRIVVSGMPGSGKTIVAVYLLKYLMDNDKFQGKSIGFVVPQTSLRKTMKAICRSIYGLSPSQVLGPSDVTKRKYDILLVDEAHRLHRYRNISHRGAFKENCERLGLTTDSDELDWIFLQSESTVLFYDEAQVVGPSGIDVKCFETKLKEACRERVSAYFHLVTQMRVLGGNDYIAYIKDLLNGSCKEKREFDGYDFTIAEHFEDFERKMYEKEKEFGLTRMIAGYAWEWKSKTNPACFDIEIDGISRRWNHCTAGWVHTAEAIDEVGCVHSIQGYDLNYAFVILGDDIGYDPDEKKMIVRPDHYFDKNGKNTATYEQLSGYITNIYYILLTRGIKGTCLYICDDHLREYLQQYIDSI